MTIFETGATTHAVNELILFTDTTRELAELRDKIYRDYIKSTVNDYLNIKFTDLYIAAKSLYSSEMGYHNSNHIRNMDGKEIDEFCDIYSDRFENWKQENRY